MGYLGNSMTARALTLGYANARVNGMKQMLLSGRETEALLQAAGVS